ncbi:hypothetical protein SKAU_G00334740 [Synaphobranchus kaupii]|uniref:Spermatogenesis-associated protein 7 n=1 Tax=Synaphobranchus kaupii TaxID=118154 RepID=A0A9Q1ELV2_SYNKA|nr:hypothetical protein SKAU_G00334740 [Synaphobranchus kaupii]
MVFEIGCGKIILSHFCAQDISNEHEWSDEETHSVNHSDFRLHVKEQKTRWRSSDVHSSSRVSPDGMKSPLMKKVTAEEEELMYLEFIADVTNDILSRGLYSNRVLERVFARQMEMNKHRLDKDKMRHLLEVLRKDLASPSDSVTNCTELEERGGSYLPLHLLSSLGKDSISKTKEDSSIIACTVFDKVSREVDNSIHSSSPLVPENCSRRIDSPGHKQEAEESEELKSHPNSNCEPRPCEQTLLLDSESNEESAPDNLEQSKEVEDLERNLAESLCMSEDIKVIKDKHKEADPTEDLLSDSDF